MHNGAEPSLQPQQNGGLATKHIDPQPQQSGEAQAVKKEEDVNGLQIGEPQGKKRKLADVASISRPSSRAASPPWKKVAAEGPTSFLERGKRKSARTNAIPLELQPPSNKRQTRAAVNHVGHGIGVKSSSVRGAKSSPALSTSTPTHAYGKHVRTGSKSGPQIANRSSSKHPRGAGQFSTATPTKRPYRRRTDSMAEKFSPPTISTTSPTAKRRGRPPKIAKKEEPKVVTNGWHKSELDDERYDNMDVDEDDEEEKSDVTSDSSEETPVDPNFKPQRLKFKVRMPKLTAQHPGHIPFPKRYSSLREWYEEEDFFDGADPRLSEAQIKKEARTRQRIFNAVLPGGILHGQSSLDIPEPHEEPPRQYFRHDHFLAHAQDMRKRMMKEKEKHKKAAKKLGDDLMAYWQALQPKSADEVQREKDRAVQAKSAVIMRQCLYDLGMQWQVMKAQIEFQRAARWDKRKEELEKKKLNTMLEHSTQLLDTRIRRRTTSLASDGEDINGSEEASDSELEGSDVSSDDDRNFSSSESEDEEQSQGGDVNADEQLTVEELRKKYELEPVGPSEPLASKAGESVDVAMDLGNDAHSALESAQVNDQGLQYGLQSTTSSPPKRHLRDAEEEVLEGMDDSMLDESDESTDMDDDMGSSDEGIEEADHDDVSSEEGSSTPANLLGFLSKKELAPVAYDLREAPKQLEEITSPKPQQVGDGEEHEEIDEVSLIPDATQVQTPSASNDDYSTIKLESERERTVSSEAMADRPPAPTAIEMSTQKHVEQIDRTSPMEVDPASLPATPVSSRAIKTAVPHLLRGTLREYQHFGLDWLAGLYMNETNGILADEMGLGKTIQTISLLGHLAVEKGIWGPHLIVVPTSVMLNWEMEFKKFLPGFKVMTYYGSPEERKAKRKGWLDNDKWNVVITSYQLVLKDEVSFKKRGWVYLVLDEAHNIKNFQSQRWQALLGFRTQHRLLLTGTPLQNNLTELWSLMFFLMPPKATEIREGGEDVFAGLADFTSMFKMPISQILEQGRDKLTPEAQALVTRLHTVLRPYILRRLKADVEKQMPGKYEHVVYCKLSKRQRYLYDGFMSRTQTRETLAGGNYLSIINCLMQLRKVCNHPDLFETRQIVTSFAMPKSAVADYEIKELLVRRRLLQENDTDKVSLDAVDLLPGANGPVSALETLQPSRLGAIARMRQLVTHQSGRIVPHMPFDGSSIPATLSHMENNARSASKDSLHHTVYLTSLRSQRRPLMNYSLINNLLIDMKPFCAPARPVPRNRITDRYLNRSEILNDMVLDLPRRSDAMTMAIQKFACVTPTVVAPDMSALALSRTGIQIVNEARRTFKDDSFHESRMRLSIAFPDKRLLQYDCGKLQRLDKLLRTLQAGGHRALIFTQMTKVLDILEQFLNIHGHRYLRLDGSTKIEQRQIMTDRFNKDPQYLVFILSSRSGGLGINLTGADTVIFYDLDWNPAMDKQCQDRCHRIGQTRDVHIYRFVTEYTIEANILRKSNQKRLLDEVIIQEGDFTTDFFNKPDTPVVEDDALHEADAEASAAMDRVLGTGKLPSKILEQAEDKEDIAAAQIAEKEIVHTDEADFLERTPAEVTPKAHTPSRIADGEQADANELKTGVVEPRSDMARDIFAGKEPIGIDRHMVEFFEWELRDVPIGPPLGEKKKKRGAEHRVHRKR